MRLIAVLVFSFLLFSSVAFSGVLFPPDNVSPTTKACPINTVLKWTGDSVTCINPLSEVSLTCPVGKVMLGIDKGAAKCASPRSAWYVRDWNPLAGSFYFKCPRGVATYCLAVSGAGDNTCSAAGGNYVVGDACQINALCGDGTIKRRVSVICTWYE